MDKPYHILCLPGDGIGPEVMDSAKRILESCSGRNGFRLRFEEALIGGAALEADGDPLPPATRSRLHQADAVLLGAVGGPQWAQAPYDKRPEAGLLALRKELEVYANLRPVRIFEGLKDLSPLRPEIVQGTDFLILRELTGGIYFGEPRGEESNSAFETQTYNAGEIRRIAQKAFEIARSRRQKVTLVDKANVLMTSRLWRRVVGELQQSDYPDIALDYLYVDNAAMQIIRNPAQFDVILTDNLFGDILSDEAAVLCGSLGLLPSASLGDPDRPGLFEPIHGSAPDIAGQGKANPAGMVLSAAMMLRYGLRQEKAATQIETAVQKSLQSGLRTPDLGGTATTQDMTDAILQVQH